MRSARTRSRGPRVPTRRYRGPATTAHTTSSAARPGQRWSSISRRRGLSLFTFCCSRFSAPRTRHAIADPKAPADLFRLLDLERAAANLHIPLAPKPKPVPNVKPQNPKAEYNCLACPPAKNPRMFILEGVKSHLKAKCVACATAAGLSLY